MKIVLEGIKRSDVSYDKNGNLIIISDETRIKMKLIDSLYLSRVLDTKVMKVTKNKKLHCS